MLFPQLLPAHHAVHNVPIFNIIYASSALVSSRKCIAFKLPQPSAISQIYKEVAFNDRELNVNYMQVCPSMAPALILCSQYCVAIYQVAIGLLTAPLNALPFLGPREFPNSIHSIMISSERIPLDGMSSMVTNGSACLFLARNSIVEVGTHFLIAICPIIRIVVVLINLFVTIVKAPGFQSSCTSSSMSSITVSPY